MYVNRSKETSKYICMYVRPRPVISKDCWAIYKYSKGMVDNDDNAVNYVHYTINHSEAYGDLATGTQHACPS